MSYLARTLLRFVFSAVGILVASALLPGIRHGSFPELLGVAVLLAFLNATLGMLLKRLAFIPVACSFGCLSLVINGLVFWLAGGLAARLGLGFSVTGFWAAFFGALLASVTASLMEAVLIGRQGKARHQAGPGKPRNLKQIN